MANETKQADEWAGIEVEFTQNALGGRKGLRRFYGDETQVAQMVSNGIVKCIDPKEAKRIEALCARFEKELEAEQNRDASGISLSHKTAGRTS